MRRPLIALISIVVCLAGAGSALAGKPPKPGGGGSGAAATVTTMACGDPEVHVRGHVSCPVRVGDAKGTGIPEGIVTFAVTRGSGTLYADQCQLQSGECAMTFMPTAPGTIVVTSTYAGNATWGASSGSFSFSAHWSTLTTLSCSTAKAAAGATVDCTADTYADPANTAPAGTFTLSTTGTGTLARVSCASTSACRFSYTTPAGPENATLTATFPGDASYSPSSASVLLESGKRDAQLVTVPGATAGVYTAPVCVPSPLPYLSCAPVPRGFHGTPGTCAAMLLDATTHQALAGRTVTFSGYCRGSVVTDARGIATMQGFATPPDGICSIGYCSGLYGYVVRFGGDAEYFSA
jgi:hypothetical protein